MVTLRKEEASSPDLLTATQFAERLGVSLRTLRRLMDSGRVPQPVRYSRKLVRWKKSVVDQYIEELM